MQRLLPANRATGIYWEHARFQVILVDIVSLYIGKNSHVIPTWLKRHIATKGQVPKVHYT